MQQAGLKRYAFIKTFFELCAYIHEERAKTEWHMGK